VTRPQDRQRVRRSTPRRDTRSRVLARKTVMIARTPPAWVMGALALLIVGTFTLRILIPTGMDPTVFLAFGEESPVQTAYAERLLGDVATRPSLGHDGRFFFPQANDPWYLQPARNAAVLDRPIYRGQRMLFPVIAGGLGFFPPGVVVWSMLITNLLALAIAAWLAARLAASWGASTWLGVSVPLNIGLLFELDIGGAGILAYTFCLGAVLALVNERTELASLLFGAAALSREVMVAFAVGVLLLWWLEERQLLWRIVLTPLLAVSAWYVYLSFRLSGVSGVGGGTENFTAPFVGIFEALRSWIRDPSDLLVNLSLLVVVVAFTPLALRSRVPIAWGALPFVALATVLSVNVWLEPFNFTRALAPVFTAAPFLVVLSRGHELAIGAGRFTRTRANIPQIDTGGLDGSASPPLDPTVGAA
jgi:hypothetical protein